MFGFDKDEDGAQFRYVERKVLFEKAHKRFPHARYYWWWLIHNIVSHPLIGLLPIKIFFNLHDWTSRRMHPPVEPLTREEKIKIGKAHLAYTMEAMKALREDCIREGRHARSRKFCEYCHTLLINEPHAPLATLEDVPSSVLEEHFEQSEETVVQASPETRALVASMTSKWPVKNIEKKGT